VFAFDKTKAALPGEDGPHAKAVNQNLAKKPVEKMIKVKNVNDASPADQEVGGNRKER
jgi:hypothetical protein